MDWITFINYFAIFFAIWQFVRDAKFCRIPYAIVNSVWHQGIRKTWFMEREILEMRGSYSSFHDRKSECDYATVFKWKEASVDDEDELGKMVSFEIEGESHTLYLDNHGIGVIKHYLSDRQDCVPVRESKYLMRKTFFCQSASDSEVVEHLINGGFVERKALYCLYEQSSGFELNKNFTKAIQIAPLSLQARGFNTPAAVLTILNIVLDQLNKPANKLWKVFKFYVYVWTKYALNYFPKSIRSEVSGILSSASEGFLYCDDSKYLIYSTVFDKGIPCSMESHYTDNTYWFYKEAKDADFKPERTVGDPVCLSYFCSGKEFKLTYKLRVPDDRPPQFLLGDIYVTDGEVNFKREDVEFSEIYNYIVYFKSLDGLDSYPLVYCRSRYAHLVNPINNIRDKIGVSSVHMVRLMRYNKVIVSQCEIPEFSCRNYLPKRWQCCT
jgi:hypothetical protein